MAVTRTELASHVEAVFAHGPTSRDNLLACAVGSHARPEVIAVIQALPDKTYSTLRALWTELAHVPIG